MTGYEPGTCNIGRRQRLRRAAVAAAAFVLSAGYVAAYFVGLLPKLLLLGVFVPLVIGFEWGLQAYEAFCVTLGVLGRYDFRSDRGGDAGEGTEDATAYGEVTDPANRQADHVRAAKITATAVLLASALTVALAFVV